MTIAIILNGIAKRKKLFLKKILPVLKKQWKVDLFVTRTPDDAFSLASSAVKNNYDLILAAGGDGTLNQIINGVINNKSGQESYPVIGVIPVGSGNDFARSLQLQASAAHLTELIREFKSTIIDIGKVTFLSDGKKTVHYFINEADIGMGPEVVKKVMRSSNTFGGGIAYYRAILSTFLSFKPFHVMASTPSWDWEGKIRTLAVANGKYYGHGLCIAPDARPDDGVFSVFVAGDVSIVDFILCTGKLRSGKKLNLEKVHYREASSISLEAGESHVIEADGELIGTLPATITLLPKKLRFLR